MDGLHSPPEVGLFPKTMSLFPFVPKPWPALTARPMAADIQKTCPAVTFPRIFRCPTAANPIDAMQPHREQSGVPPNWHGSTLVRRSADNERVVLAKMHRSGEAGGLRNSLIMPSCMSSLFSSRQMRRRISTTCLRSSESRHSMFVAPLCGVKILIQIFFTFGLADHISTNSGM